MFGKLNLKLWLWKCHFVFSFFQNDIRVYINAAVFMIWYLTYNSKHITIEKCTTHCTMDLQKNKFTNLYRMDQLWWEMYKKECGEFLTDVKSEGLYSEEV